MSELAAARFQAFRGAGDALLWAQQRPQPSIKANGRAGAIAAQMRITEGGAGDGEGALSIVAWAGYIERGETDKAFEWLEAALERRIELLGRRIDRPAQLGDHRLGVEAGQRQARPGWVE